MRLVPRGLRGRLLVANLVVAGAAIGTVLLGVSLVGPGYFQEAMGHRPGDPAGQQMDALILAAFHEATRTALLAAAVTALGAAVVVSLAISSRIASPVSRLVGAARRIAGGHYAERVPMEGEGEVAELASAFNLMSASLESTERRRMQLVGDVAHELRTPLATLDGYLEGLQDSVIEAKPETWELLRRETHRLTRLVGDLSELWRAGARPPPPRTGAPPPGGGGGGEARELALRTEPVQLGEVVEEAIKRFMPSATEHGVRLESAVAPGAVALADRDRVVQILGNFISNALRHSPQGTSVLIGASRTGSLVELSVRDAGPGLSAEQLGQVFERFYRLDAARSRGEGGAGIGLAIVRALAEAMGGRAWAESHGSGNGSTFRVSLPAAASP